MEKASVDKACEELSLNLAPSYAIRRQYREVCLNHCSNHCLYSNHERRLIVNLLVYDEQTIL